MLDPLDLRVTSYLPQSGYGAGGQQVGLTTSGVIVHHIPTGLGVSCDSERSQYANKERAIKMLESLVNQETQKDDEFTRLMALVTERCPELILTPVLMNTPISNRTMQNKVSMIKEVREKAGCGLREAKLAVDEVYGYSVDYDDVITKATLWAMSR
jgi:hypothetical protein